ncbi:MAG: hypothetical protein ABS35_34065 [Kaistia sp. SCN 65-12]|mgnify:FL=1|nr:MAG: hypothetical protein ABS35_34065 [Kaistia sp. SCN 65-12]
MKAAEAMIAWTPDREPFLNDPTRGQVRIGALLQRDEADWSRPFAKTGGAAYVARQEIDGWEQIANVFIDFQNLVVDEGIDAKVAHAEFLKIDEYKHTLTNPPLLETFSEG